MGPHCCFTRERIIETKRFTYCTKNIQFKGLCHRTLWIRGMNPLSFGWASFCFGQSHIMLRGASFNLYMEICDMGAGNLCRTKLHNQCTLQCVEKCSNLSHVQPHQNIQWHSRSTLPVRKGFWPFIPSISRHEWERLYLYTDTWQVTGPVQWHIEWIQMGFYNKSINTLHLTLQPSTFFWEKKYIENTTYNQIHFQVILFLLCRGESKCSIHVHERTNSNRLTPKDLRVISNLKPSF